MAINLFQLYLVFNLKFKLFISYRSISYFIYLEGYNNYILQN
jgi:hypothetical protein